MLTALSVIHNLGYIQCVRSILDDRKLDTNVVLFMEKPYEFKVPVITIGLDDFKKSSLFKSLDNPKWTSRTHVFSSTHEEMSWKNMKHFARLKKDTIFANVSSGDISVGIFRKYEIKPLLLGSCEDSTSLKASIYSWLKYQKHWKYPVANVCYTVDTPFTTNHESKVKKGVVLDIHEMIHKRIGIKASFIKTNLWKKSRKSTEKRLQTLMNSRFCDYFLQSTMGHFENRYDFTTPSFSDSLFLYAPTASLVPKWRYVYQILSKCVWYFWLSTLFILVMFWHLLPKVFRRTVYNIGFFRRLWILLKVTVEQDSFSVPRSATELIIITAFILESFVMIIAYKCKFIEFLSSNNYEYELNTLQDIIDHEFKIGFLPLLKGLFSHNKELKNYLREHYVHCDFSLSCIDRAANTKDIIVLVPESKLFYNFERYVDTSGKFKLRKIGTIVSAMTFNSIFRRGHPLYPVVEKELLNLVAHGFVQKIYKDYVKFVGDVEENSRSNQKLNLKHLQLSFFILLLGWILGGLLFLCEIMNLRYFSNK